MELSTRPWKGAGDREEEHATQREGTRRPSRGIEELKGRSMGDGREQGKRRAR
jgi:hypothetical protein